MGCGLFPNQLKKAPAAIELQRGPFFIYLLSLIVLIEGRFP